MPGRFDEIALSTLRNTFGPVDEFADIWCKVLKLKFLDKHDGRIGPLLQSQCDELASALEQISQAPEPSKVFQAMLDMAVAHALDLTTQPAGKSPAGVV